MLRFTQSQPMASAPPSRICLNMIVRNEGRVIRRLLDSVRDVVSEYVIVDTGSTDDTIDQIKAYPLPGVVIREPFVNFGASRTFALEQARLHSSCDYLLLLDADMELLVTEALPTLSADAYLVAQRQGTLLYENVRLLRRDLGATCVGATHEYYSLPPGSTQDRLPEATVVVVDHGDGGSKADKFERDIRLLEAELRDDPANARAVFYLAQSLFDTQQYSRAIDMYKRRIALGGWEQEVAYSRLRVAMAYANMKEWDQARAWTLLAQSDAAGPGRERAEPGYYMCRALREAGDHDLAYYFLIKALRIPKPPTADCLFIEEAVYDYLLKFELTVLWYYVHPTMRSLGVDLSVAFLDLPGVPDSFRECVYDNLAFYLQPLAAHPSCPAPRRLFPDECLAEAEDDGPWRYSSPGFLPDGTVYARLVNYVLGDDGGYHAPDNVIRTRLLVGVQIIDAVRNATPRHHPHVQVRGLEDTRVVGDAGDGAFYTLSASCEYGRSPEAISQVVGRLDLGAGEHTVLAAIASPFDSPCEKNWVAAGSLERVVYRWYPDIWVGRVDLASETLQHTHSIASPGSFLGMRGSTNGVLFRGRWWFVTHTVVGTTAASPRRYAHRLVALNEALTEVAAVSKPFVFEPGADTEYCLGLRIVADNGGTACFGYSVRDRLPRTLEIPLPVLVPDAAAAAAACLRPPGPRVQYVTAWVDLGPGYQAKRPEDRLRHFQTLAAAGLPLVVFLSPAHRPAFEAAVPPACFPHVDVVEVDWEELEASRAVRGHPRPLALPAVRNTDKDTEAFLRLMLCKPDFVARAMALRGDATHFAWIDFNIAHTLGDAAKAFGVLKGLEDRPLRASVLAFPGQQALADVPGDEALATGGVHWRFLGGFFLGDRTSLRRWCSLCRAALPVFLEETSALVWEVNFWAWVERRHKLALQWYRAGFDDSMLTCVTGVV